MSKTASATVPTEAGADKSKDWQLEILMEKLRAKANQYKSLAEIAKNVRMTMLDKRYALDSVEKSQHQKCLDTLQHSIKVTSLQSMIERLESLTRQLGLKFMVSPSGVELFISSDMFYLEIILNATGAVEDVKVHHEGKKEQQSCAELVNCLSLGDFQDFTAHLEGFASIYQLNAEKKIKSKAYVALQSLESDLSTLAQLQSFMKEPFNLVYKSPVGILEKRKGGHPMKLIYFVSPYDLLDSEKHDLAPINVDFIMNKNIGYNVTVCMEGSAAQKLQTSTLITISRGINGKSTPSFSPLTNQNSSIIPATFVLKLNKPIPMCISLVHQIQNVCEQEWADLTTRQPLLNLIVNQASDGKLSSQHNQGLFVTLPDQNHCYFMTENPNMEGILVSSIPFTHPAKVSQILVILRQQALFNTIIASCVRPESRQDFDNMTMLEISVLSWAQISISLEHPIQESMATAELDLAEISKLSCKIHTPGTPPPPNAPDVASELTSKVLNKCFSIPITMRSIIKLWERQAMPRSRYNGHENFSLPLDSCDPGGGGGGHKGGPGGEFEGLDASVKQESVGGAPHNVMMHQNQGMFLNETLAENSNFSNFPSSEGVLSNMELTNILSDTTEKVTKRHKRRGGDDAWKSSKRKTGEDNESLLETSSCDSTSRSTPLSSQDTEIPTPCSGLEFQSDLELSGLDPAELLGGGDSDKNSEFNTMEDLDELLPEPAIQRRKSRDQKSPNDLLLELGDKNLVPPNVSITPILSSTSNFLQGDKHEAIDIASIAPSMSSSITITPISQNRNNEERVKEKRSKSKSDDRNRMEKKRKRKREESPMGPPDKIPPKQDSLPKPVTLSMKTSESPPLSITTPTSPGLLKYNASPTHSRNLSPSLMKPSLKSGSSHHSSPKHSPAHVSNSPKHIPGISSPKSHGTSPKHTSMTSSGKPSMSTLKSATNSPSSKSESKSKSNSKESSRERDKKSGSSAGSSSTSSSKIKTSSKLKLLDLSVNIDGTVSTQDNLPSPSGSSDIKMNLNQARNRKGSLSAIVDKLKSAQHCESISDLIAKSSSSKERSSPALKSSSESKSLKLGENKNSEYMVKPSSDGIKLTINKTRTKDSRSGMKSGSSSPKVHTGLKPGVISGPASKKPQHTSLKSSSSLTMNNVTINKISSKTSLPSAKSSSSGLTSKSSKLSGSPKTSSSGNKDRIKVSKSSSEKSIFSSKERGKSSPTSVRDELDSSPYKFNSSSIMMEGLMKQLDKNFQIPKLSARLSDDKKQNKSGENLNNLGGGRPDSAKIFDITKSDLKYPILSNNKMDSIETKIRNNMNSLNEDDKRGLNYVTKSFPSANIEPLSLTKSVDLTTRFIAPAPKDDKKDVNKKTDCELLLDYSSASKLECGKGAVTMSFPQSPSVSVHIVKSPAPSPRINPSPHTVSPCITDDELMDEALVGSGK